MSHARTADISEVQRKRGWEIAREDVQLQSCLSPAFFQCHPPPPALQRSHMASSSQSDMYLTLVLILYRAQTGDICPEKARLQSRDFEDYYTIVMGIIEALDALVLILNTEDDTGRSPGSPGRLGALPGGTGVFIRNFPQGKPEINFHNSDNIIPLAITDLPAYYAKAGYTIPGYSTGTSSATPSPTAIGQASSTPALSITPASTSASTPASTPATKPASTGLSTGAKAGIGAGVGVAAAVIVALLAALIFMRRRYRNDKSDPTPGIQSQTPRYSNGLAPRADPLKRELSGDSGRPEMAAHDPLYSRGELPTNVGRHEMDGW
ncbi:MAG: hypothetical protein Q9224_002950 [Gallowayella concinna]